MNFAKLIGCAAVIAAAASPAFAADMMMKKGETMMVMPNGETATMSKMDAAMGKEMMMHAKPMSGCMMMMMGEDGKMYMMEDMKMANGKMACESMSKM